MKQTHTPGPWLLVDKSHSGAFQILPEDRFGLRIATVTNASNDEANARLISAAPDLLEALQRIMDTGTVDAFEGRRALAVIAKAKGKS